MNKVLGTLTTVAVLALVLAVFLGQRWKGEAGRRAVELAQARERYTADSSAFVKQIAALEDSITELTVAGDSLKAGWAISREAAGAALITLRNVAAGMPPGGNRAAVNVAIGTIIQEREACSLVVTNCEARVSAQERARAETVVELQRTQALLMQTEQVRLDAERRASPWGVGVTGGLASVPGKCSGAGASIGLTYRQSIRLPWPFR